jgi:hypothetical protein
VEISTPEIAERLYALVGGAALERLCPNGRQHGESPIGFLAITSVEVAFSERVGRLPIMTLIGHSVPAGQRGSSAIIIGGLNDGESPVLLKCPTPIGGPERSPLTLWLLQSFPRRQRDHSASHDLQEPVRNVTIEREAIAGALLARISDKGRRKLAMLINDLLPYPRTGVIAMSEAHLREDIQGEKFWRVQTAPS